ncbi:50S ribosomal protein L23 [bacterium SCSIO 12696]|uniref:50S ribosomal protein L23 n=1 Tax=Porticoccus sp. W117 TaxID=3054777 RepID=UPI0021FF29EF|nr:50S ribosomal protein L23 [Porticoccus sp. W117]MDM3870637.1 50S ribosomal protein L23 [Porticoccus sp. W117]UTW44898.1 50S ribosomal protein L23 [bacterium SCSIO 12696]
MNQEIVFKTLLGPHVSEKAAVVAEGSNQVIFKVAKTATKREVKAAVEQLFKVDVLDVRTVVTKGKAKRTRYGMGKRSDWKKAYVRLAEGQEIDFAVAE